VSWTFPLGKLLLCLRVITVNPALVTSDNFGQEGCILLGDLTLLFLISFQISHVGTSHMSDIRKISIAMQRLIYFISMVNNKHNGLLKLIVRARRL
jgi:hypothetical protein